MKLSSNGIDFLKKEEGFRSNMYYDAAGLPTIGYGTLIDTPEEQKFLTQPISEEEAERLFLDQLTTYEKAVNDSIKTPIQQHQFDALVSLAYNIGPFGFKTSTVVKKINNNEQESLIRAWWTAWNKAGGKVLTALQNRREREVELFFSNPLKKK